MKERILVWFVRMISYFIFPKWIFKSPFLVGIWLKIFCSGMLKKLEEKGDYNKGWIMNKRYDD